MNGGFSLQRRLGVGLAAGVTLMWLAATLGAGIVVRHELDEAFDSALQETAQRLLPLAVIGIIERDGSTAQAVTALGKHEEFLTYLVRDKSGRVLLRSHDADPEKFPAEPSRGFRQTATHRIYGEAAISGTIFIQVAEPLAHRRSAALEASAALFLPLFFLVPVSLLGVWVFVRRSMRPVIGLKEEIEARGGADLSPLAARALPTEIGPITDAVNRLMERVRRTLETERSFTANSAHELRTPIAATLAQTQRLIAEAPEGPVRDRAHRIEGLLHDLARLSEKLMQLAKAEGSALLSERPQDLAGVLVHVLDEFRRKEEPSERLRLLLPEGASLMSPMDPDAFGVLMRNLIENALKHGEPGRPIDVSVMDDNVIRVTNDGPVVPPDALARLKERFARGATRAKGAGLGLAIAEAIATGAGGELLLLSPAGGRQGGFEAVVRLPA
ncbi:MAG: sensor histidine kinase N-terminal domain-containing protein [Rhodospirillales bacterium]|nr:sensor histidine kinase N-terminal domain-containing protein [Rhodospirillales bacterium]